MAKVSVSTKKTVVVSEGIRSLQVSVDSDISGNFVLELRQGLGIREEEPKRVTIPNSTIAAVLKELHGTAVLGLPSEDWR